LRRNKSRSKKISIPNSKKSRGKFLCIRKASRREKPEKVELIVGEKGRKGKRMREMEGNERNNRRM